MYGGVRDCLCSENNNRANLPYMNSGTSGSRTGGTDVVAKMSSSAEAYIRSGVEMC